MQEKGSRCTWSGGVDDLEGVDEIDRVRRTPIRQQKRTPPNNQGGVGRQQQIDRV